MKNEKLKIAVIEDKYRQFQIIEKLLNPYFEIFPIASDYKDFNVKKSKLMDYLNNNGNDIFLQELPQMENISAFVIDYELKKGSNKTGVFFAQITKEINNGTKPVLFLTKISDSNTTNAITKLPQTNPAIRKSYLRKPELWEDSTKEIESIANHTQSFGNDMKVEIDFLVSSSQTKQIVSMFEIEINKKKDINTFPDCVKDNGKSLFDFLDKLLNKKENLENNQKLLDNLKDFTAPFTALAISDFISTNTIFLSNGE